MNMGTNLNETLDRQWLAGGRAILVGIAGGSGSGKSTLANRLKESLDGRCEVIEQDSYYHCNANVPLDERTKINYDHPDSVELDLLAAHLRELKNGNAIDKPHYDFVTHSRTKMSRRLLPRPVIIVEGLFLFVEKELRDLFDLRVFVDADWDLRLLRRLKRDVSERGRTIESVLRQYKESVSPMHDAFIAEGQKWGHCLVKTHTDCVVDPVLEHLAGMFQDVG